MAKEEIPETAGKQTDKAPPEAVDMTLAEPSLAETPQTPPDPEPATTPESSAPPILDPAPVASPAPPPASASAPPAKRGGFLPLVLGGVVAGAIGYGLAFVQDQQGGGGTDVAAELAARDATIAELQSRLSNLEGTTADLADGPDIGPLQSEVEAASTAAAEASGSVAGLRDDLTASIDALGEDVSGFEDRLTNLEQRPEADGSLSTEAIDAYEREIAGLREETAQAVDDLTSRVSSVEDGFEELRAEITDGLAAVRAEAAAVETQSEAAATAAEARAALSGIRSGVESGVPYADAMETFVQIGAAEAPEVLAANADGGVPSVATLRAEFPDAAREALATVRSENEGGGMGGFFQRQFNVRSVEPREGDSADAVLSRAEAAVAEGRLQDALAEIETLPDGAKEALSGWTEAATTRVEALAAVDTLTQMLTAN
ncbi:hypothetical protein ROA7023_01029 [Roseisalinus antarcticus]|uniref:Mitochondrial inner membrane protein n=1 Tax=Roseisalinus antarcticus TaxID=254357 RepID=A0A1Y5S2U8_9RHOB|nr:hypothetical protein ROA7023_01029 [Roseisalinus antarcticus]